MLGLLFPKIAFSAARLFTLLVLDPSGAQQVIKIEQSGDYYDASRILCDERVDGAECTKAFPGASTVSVDAQGKKTVTVDNAAKAAILAAKAAAEDSVAQEKTACDGVRAKVLSDTATLAELRQAVKCFLKAR